MQRIQWYMQDVFSFFLLFSLQPMGVFAILEEECIVPKATDMTFLEKMNKNHGDGKHPKYAKAKTAGKNKADYHFELTHYAGVVGYNVDGWLQKNKDPINEAVATLFSKSSDPFVAGLFKEFATESQYRGALVQHVSHSFLSLVSHCPTLFEQPFHCQPSALIHASTFPSQPIPLSV